ncbi:hypothetical protein COV11_04370 [Candidatus Woesearchaeota archaeon CG10_big_fil_rev_8_21_14_0_10_30_7]|nr:MAG: hypothetical protein COV11_04370 [Candidatus Woesearchaeota archaeon CG10_big_fil_rev_8_21_14_0_10_30_7]
MEIIKIKLKPNSKENKIISKGTIWEIKIKEPAIDNRANKELVKFLKKELKKQVRIVKGMKSKEKIIEIN